MTVPRPESNIFWSAILETCNKENLRINGIKIYTFFEWNIFNTCFKYYNSEFPTTEVILLQYNIAREFESNLRVFQFFYLWPIYNLDCFLNPT